SGRVGWREVLGGMLVALVPALPFLLWDAGSFWQGVVGFHLHSPFRPDSLSLPALVYQLRGTEMSALVAFGAVAVVFALHAGVRRPSLAQATFAGALAFLSFFLLNKQAFRNYYWFAGSLLLATIPLAAAEARERPPEESPSPPEYRSGPADGIVTNT